MKRLLLFVALLSLPGLIFSAPRTRDSFNDGWRFARFGPMPNGELQAEPRNLQGTQVDDSEWRELKLPHDWAIEGPFRQDLPGATGKLPWEGIGWYRKNFKLPAEDAGQRVFIDFDGAMSNAQVWLNGTYVGEWPYGYASFRLELTEHLRFGGDNTIAVRLDTTKIGSRWYPGAGIYRNVWLVKTDPVHIAHWGTQVTTPEISEKQAKVRIRATVNNDSSEKAAARLIHTIHELSPNDRSGPELARIESATATIDVGGHREFDSSLILPNPKLWDLETPQRYVVRTEVFVGDQRTDRYDSPFGIRSIEFKGDGFYLNGRKTMIQGVCLHHDLGPLGAAVNIRARERQFEILKEMGCNSVRTSHNPPEPELVTLADKMGILLQVESFDSWHVKKRDNDYSTLFWDWWRKDVSALVRHYRNHPSVFMWCSGNEIGSREHKLESGEWLSSVITAEFHRLDPTRPVTFGANGDQTRQLEQGFDKTIDVFGFNYGIAHYESFRKHERNKNRPYHGSETASTVSSRGEYFFPVNDISGDSARDNAFETKARADFQMTGYDVAAPRWGVSPDHQFAALERHPDAFGEYVWTGFDYWGEPTPYNQDVTNLLNFSDPAEQAKMMRQLEEIGKISPPSRSSYFGIMDLCGFKKDRFYLYQSQWRPDLPMAHILPHWNWPERMGKVTPVHVYTSGDEAELFLNGRSLGRRTKVRPLFRMVWDDVIYEPGELRVVAYKNGQFWAGSRMETTGAATALRAEADRTTIANDGLDLSFVTFSIRDSEGRLVPRSHNEIEFSIEGPGEIVATGNGDATSHDSLHDERHKAFNGLCLVILRAVPGETGTIRLKGSSDGLTPTEIEVEAL